MHPLYGHNSLKEENFGQSIWDKSVMLLTVRPKMVTNVFSDKNSTHANESCNDVMH